MAENCPLPGETLPMVQIDGVTMHPVAPNIPPGGDPGSQGVQIQVDLSVRQVLEDINEPNWLQDETLIKYLNLRVIQVRRPEADAFLAGAISDLARRNLIGKSILPYNIGEAVLRQDELFFQNGFLDYAGQSYEHRTSNRGISTPQYRRSREKVENLINMFVEEYNPEFENFYRLFYPSVDEENNRVSPFPWPEDKPDHVDFIAPGGFEGEQHRFGTLLVGNMIYNPLGVKQAGLARDGYTKLGRGDNRLYFRDDNIYMQAEGIVTLYDSPLMYSVETDDGTEERFSFGNVEVTTEGEATEVQARLNSVHFGNRANPRDKTLTSRDIQFLRYHAFLYVDLNRLLADMEDDDD